jgi:hypothetical protein
MAERHDQHACVCHSRATRASTTGRDEKSRQVGDNVLDMQPRSVLPLNALRAATLEDTVAYAARELSLLQIGRRVHKDRGTTLTGGLLTQEF